MPETFSIKAIRGFISYFSNPVNLSRHTTVRVTNEVQRYSASEAKGQSKPFT
jgi:hypothetical protein